jgi:hypothetical protein
MASIRGGGCQTGGQVCQTPLVGLLEQPGASISLTSTGMDSAQVSYKCPRYQSGNFAPDVGCGHPCENWLAVKTVVHTNDGSFDIINVTYEGCSDDKFPTGGVNIGVMENPIALHPNYKSRAGTWGTVFGAGKSPNEFGRLLDEDGAFKAFGPFPDGRDGRPNAAADPGADQLEGVEAFLDPGQMTYKYNRLTVSSPGESSRCLPSNKGRWACEVASLLATRTSPKSRSCPPCKLPPSGRNWLLTSVSEEIRDIGTRTVYNTSVEFLGSGDGGWNPLIYKPGGTYTLD